MTYQNTPAIMSVPQNKIFTSIKSKFVYDTASQYDPIITGAEPKNE